MNLNIITVYVCTINMNSILSRFYQVVKSTTSWKRPSGLIAGIVAAWTIFGIFLPIDSDLHLPPGIFYQMIGLTFDTSSVYAMDAGFFLYMVTAAIIGIIYGSISNNVKKLHITSVPKGLGTGILAGIIVRRVLFIPINALVIQPDLQNSVNTQGPNSAVYSIASHILKLSNTIIYGSLALHLVLAAVMGFCGRLAVV
jgi:hypothetical protein